MLYLIEVNRISISKSNFKKKSIILTYGSVNLKEFLHADDRLHKI